MKIFVGQNCRNFDLVPKILSAKNFVRRNFVDFVYRELLGCPDNIHIFVCRTKIKKL